MKCAAVVSSVAKTNVPSFIKIGSTIQNFMGGGDTETHR
jgi:hypothetical protein